MVNKIRKIRNPAERLFQIVSFIQSRNKDEIGITCLSALFHRNFQSARLIEKWGRILTLPYQAQLALQCYPDEVKQLYGDWIRHMPASLAKFSISDKIEAFQKSIEPECFKGLEFCAHFLSSNKPESLIQQTDLDRIQEMVKDLITKTIAAQMPDVQRKFLLLHLDLIDRAIDDYDILSNAGLEMAVYTTIGRVSTNKTWTGPASSTELFKKFVEILQSVCLILNIVNGVSGLPNNVKLCTKLLTSDAHVEQADLPQSKPVEDIIPTIEPDNVSKHN